MFRMEADSDGKTTTIHLIGRIRAEHLGELRKIVQSGVGRIQLNLNEVTLVDVDTVRFLCTCEGPEVELVDCPAYIREWMVRERQETRR
jgi:hypothetical protein